MLELSEKLVSKELDIMDSMERKFVREGRIKKNGNERVMLLFSDLLVLAKESTKKGQAMYDVRRVIPLQAARLRSHRHHPKAGSKALGFDVMAPEPGGKRYTADFAASSDEERESWLAALKAQVMAQLQRAELRDSFEGEPVCVYGQHHQLCDGTLAHAALAGDADTVRRLREHDGDEFGHLVGEQDEFGATPLAIAAFAGEVEVLDLMLTAEGVKPRLRSLGAERDSDGLTLLCRAAARGHSDVIGVLAQATDLVEGLHVVDGGDASTPVFDLNRTDARGSAQLFPARLPPPARPPSPVADCCDCRGFSVAAGARGAAPARPSGTCARGGRGCRGQRRRRREDRAHAGVHDRADCRRAAVARAGRLRGDSVRGGPCRAALCCGSVGRAAAPMCGRSAHGWREAECEESPGNVLASPDCESSGC